MTILKYILYLALAVLCIDGLYALYIHVAWSRAEKKIVRDENEVRGGCREFALGEGETAILLVHGFADSPALWQDVAPELAAEGYHVRSIRLEGFAGPADEAKLVAPERWQASVKKAVQELQNGYDHVWIAAHSLGAAITLGAYPKLDDPVDGLVLLAPCLDVSSQRSPVFSARTWFRLSDAITLLTRRTQSAFPIDALDARVRDTHPRDLFPTIRIIRSLFQTRDIAWENVDAAFPPVLMLQAGQDQIVDNESARHYFDQMNSPKKECLVFPESGHILPRDTQWRDALIAMLKFMKGDEGSTLSSR